jgi:hypothetical protein
MNKSFLLAVRHLPIERPAMPRRRMVIAHNLMDTSP